MSSSSSTSAYSVIFPRRTSRPRRNDPSRERAPHIPHVDPTQCIGMTGMLSVGSNCKRRVVWEITGTGRFCHSCFEAFHAASWKKLESKGSKIIRLSDEEADFLPGVMQ